MSTDKPYEITISVRGVEAGDEAVRHLEGPLEHTSAQDVAADIVTHMDSRSRNRLKTIPNTDR